MDTSSWVRSSLQRRIYFLSVNPEPLLLHAELREDQVFAVKSSLVLNKRASSLVVTAPPPPPRDHSTESSINNTSLPVWTGCCTATISAG